LFLAKSVFLSVIYWFLAEEEFLKKGSVSRRELFLTETAGEQRDGLGWGWVIFVRGCFVWGCFV